MSDLLGSILDSMTAPPKNTDIGAMKRRKAVKRKREEDARKRAERVREVQKEVNEFMCGTEKEFSFKPSEKEWRAIQHEMAEMSGLMSVSCDNGSSQEKHVTIFKKDSFPGEEEIKKRRLGANYIEDYSRSAKEFSAPKPSGAPMVPSRNYQDKYKKFLNTEVKGDSRQFHGLVPVHMLCSEAKSIEDSLNEIRDKKRVKSDNQVNSSTVNQIDSSALNNTTEK